jgi:uncharacterized protein with HEPN domain
MRLRDVQAELADVLAAGEAIERFIGTMDFDEYVGDEVIVAAVERKFEIVGEALARALRADPALERRLPEAIEVIGFRNVLAHGYDIVSDEAVYDSVKAELPGLLAKVRHLLGDPETS